MCYEQCVNIACISYLTCLGERDRKEIDMSAQQDILLKAKLQTLTYGARRLIQANGSHSRAQADLS